MRSKNLLWAIVSVLAIAVSSISAQTQASAFLDDTILQDISLNVDPGDWASLKQHYLDDTYYHASFSWGGVTQAIGIKSRGTGSRSPIKPNLTLKFSKYVKGQSFLGLDSIALKANNQDASNLHEWIFMKLFRRMGLPAPREAPGRLFINGEYFGFYTIVESVDETFLRRNFGEDTGYLYEWDAPVTYNLTDLGADPSLYAPFLELKTNQSAPDLQNFVSLVETINRPESAAFTGDDFITALSHYIDPRLFLTYAALECALDDYDGILDGVYGMNNFYLYQFQGQTRYQMIAWDKDLSFGWAYRDIFDGITNGPNLNALAQRLIGFPQYNTAYLSALAKAASLLGGPDGWAQLEISRQYSLIHDAATNDPNKQCSFGGVLHSCGSQDFEDEVRNVRSFLALRSGIVLSQVTSAGYAGTTGDPQILGGVEQISSGALVNVQGANLGMLAAARSLPLPRVFGDTFVAVEGVRAPMVVASSGQIEIQAPWDLPLGNASIVVSVNGVMSNTFVTSVQTATPAILSVVHADGSLVSPENPAAAREPLTLYLTGLGSVNANLDCGAAGPSEPLATTLARPQVFLQNAPITVTFSGLTPGFAGLYQVNVLAPSTLPQSPSAALMLMESGQSTSVQLALR